MKHSLNPLILLLAIFLLLGSLPAAAVERPLSLQGAGTVTFTGGPPPDWWRPHGLGHGDPSWSVDPGRGAQLHPYL
jgi:hypothetical protein